MLAQMSDTSPELSQFARAIREETGFPAGWCKIDIARGIRREGAVGELCVKTVLCGLSRSTLFLCSMRFHILRLAKMILLGSFLLLLHLCVVEFTGEWFPFENVAWIVGQCEFIAHSRTANLSSSSVLKKFASIFIFHFWANLFSRFWVLFLVNVKPVSGPTG